MGTAMWVAEWQLLVLKYALLAVYPPQSDLKSCLKSLLLISNYSDLIMHI